MSTIPYPFMPEDGSITYVGADNPFMQAAFETARDQSLDKTMPTGSVVVKDGKIIGRGANGSDFHEKNDGWCYRVENKIPTGQGYELCEGCSPKNHSEPRAIKDAQKQGYDTDGAELYLWGHWWCCEPCWTAMLTNGIKKVILLKGSEVLYNKLDDNNIVGHQIESFQQLVA